MKRKNAYVTGSRLSGYSLILRDRDAATEFYALHGRFFPKYAAAQAITNAINDYLAKRK